MNVDDTYNVRKGLAELVGALVDGNDSDEPSYTRIQLTANDVTGSLGVWGLDSQCHSL